MRSSRICGALCAITASLVLVIAAGAGAAGPTAVIKTKGGEKWVRNHANPPNLMDVNTLQWAPGTLTVHSGEKVKLIDGDKTGEPHVLAIALKKNLPSLTSNPATNPVLNAIAPQLLVDPSNPQAGFKAYQTNAGKPGLNQEGDSLVLVPGTPHRTAVWFVSAKPGTTLYYFCAVHFWMRGVIHVVK